MLPLRDLQRRLFSAIARGGPVDAALGTVVRGHGRLDAAARIEIYADMYRARLVAVLREDFPRVCAILGDDGFSALVGRYLARHPSTHPSVRHLGHGFAGHLATERLLDFSVGRHEQLGLDITALWAAQEIAERIFY